MSMELRGFEKVGATEKVSTAGYLKAREKLNPEALWVLACYHAKNVYSSNDAASYKGHLLLAVDGTSMNVPTNEETIRVYGNTSSHGRPQATCGLSVAFDTLNRQIVNTTVNRAGFDERGQVKAHLDILGDVIGKRPFMLVMDRGYQSVALIVELEAAGIPYVIRCSSRFLSKEFDLAETCGSDVTSKIEFTRNRLSWAKKKNPKAYEKMRSGAPVSARFVLIDIGGDVPERIVTNLPQDEFSALDLKEIYHLRWNIETCFSMLKDKLQAENFTGTKPHLIEQDIFAATYLLNVAYDLANEADRKLQKNGRLSTYKHEMTVNKGFAMGVVKEELIHIILAPVEERREMLLAVVSELERNLVPVRKDRSYERVSGGAPRHNRYSNTHKRVF